MMQGKLHIQTRVLPGGKIELSAPQLREGANVDVYVVPHEDFPERRGSVLDFLNSLPPGPRSADTWEAIEQRFQEERDAWER
jgi:hypothetical protein